MRESRLPLLKRKEKKIIENEFQVIQSIGLLYICVHICVYACGFGLSFTNVCVREQHIDVYVCAHKCLRAAWNWFDHHWLCDNNNRVVVVVVIDNGNSKTHQYRFTLSCSTLFSCILYSELFIHAVVYSCFLPPKNIALHTFVITQAIIAAPTSAAVATATATAEATLQTLITTTVSKDNINDKNSNVYTKIKRNNRIEIQKKNNKNRSDNKK